MRAHFKHVSENHLMVTLISHKNFEPLGAGGVNTKLTSVSLVFISPHSHRWRQTPCGLFDCKERRTMTHCDIIVSKISPAMHYPDFCLQRVCIIFQQELTVHCFH